ncbi:MAG: N-6 DNA methylase [Prevotella sp.]|jgi:type I restriction-modification system DNA methylase subunit|nr:N-6 DNA methylase [Prevotella sp.]
MKRNYKKDFIKILNSISNVKSTREVFNDFLVMATASLYSWKKNKVVEQSYTEIESQYKKETVKKFASLLAIVASALENEERDFLGNIYIEENFNNSKLYQIFTPFDLALMIAHLNFDSLCVEFDRIYTICDPCCGSGNLLIASYNVLKDKFLDIEKNILFYGKDIDNQCAMMTFMQLTLLSIPAIITCGNAISNECIWEKETLWYYQYNIGPRLKEQDKKENSELKLI